jgi:hypothetical protein
MTSDVTECNSKYRRQSELNFCLSVGWLAGCIHEVNSGVGNSNSKRLHPQHTWVDQGLYPTMVDEACLVKAKFDNVLSLTRPPPILHILQNKQLMSDLLKLQQLLVFP